MAQRAELIKQETKPRFYTDMEQMLKQDDLDAVAVITPPGLHKSQSVAAMEAGKHVFCEKPMALTVTDCNQMLEAVKRPGKALQLGTQRRRSEERRVGKEGVSTCRVRG